MKSTMLRNHSLFRPAILILISLGCFVTSAQAQPPEDPPPEETPQVDEWDAAKKIYEEKVTERKNTENKINEIFSNLVLGNREERAKQIKQIEDLKLRREELTVEVFEAAANLTQANEDGLDRQLTRLNLEYGKACMGGNKHGFPINPERTLEICEMLRERGFPAANLLPLEVHASISIQRFETAKEKINSAIEAGASKLEPLMDKVTKAEEKWNREKEFLDSENDLPTISIQTSHGEITLILYEDHAPETVRNFVSLIDQKFFDGHEFFEIKRGQMVRSGCPNNNGNSLAKYQIANEATRDDARHHFVGSISMVTNSDHTSCCHQFIITRAPLGHLDGNFPVFGRVLEGMDVMDKIVESAIVSGTSGETMPKIDSIKVLYRRPNTTYRPKKMENN